MSELLNLYQECFDRVDYYEECLRNHVFDNITSVRESIQELSGLLVAFQKPLSISITTLENNKVREYHTLKMETESIEGKKFMSAPTEREASYRVSGFRRARNTFQGYYAVCDRIVGCFQSLLSSLKQEERRPQQ